jgi:hypothetical protein
LPKTDQSTGLPDGIFSNQKKAILVTFEGSCNGRWYILWLFGPFPGYSVYFTAIYLLCFVVIWYIFPRFGMLYREKSGNPANRHMKHTNRARSIFPHKETLSVKK